MPIVPGTARDQVQREAGERTLPVVRIKILTECLAGLSGRENHDEFEPLTCVLRWACTELRGAYPRAICLLRNRAVLGMELWS